MSLTGLADKKEVFCGMETVGRMGRESAKWGLRSGNGFGESWECPPSGEGMYWEE